MHSEFSIDLSLFLDFENRYRLTDEKHTVEFEQELNKMLEAPDQSWLGTEARLDLWRKIDVNCVIGPI